MRIALATCRQWSNLSDDDRLLTPALAGHGAKAHAEVWDNPSVHWDSYDAVVIRSVWDYHRRLPDFLDWIRRIEDSGKPLLNAPDLIKWNYNKAYLKELEGRGISVLPTVWVEPLESFNPSKLQNERGWDEVVIKPAVSASGERTYHCRLAREDAARVVAELLADGTVMIQPFMHDVRDRGEWSFIYFDGQYSHAVRKVAAEDNFLVQEEYGGVTHSDHPHASLLADGRHVISGLPRQPTYARLDGFEREGRLIVSEVELIEPFLFLGYAENAVDRFADAILKSVRSA